MKGDLGAMVVLFWTAGRWAGEQSPKETDGGCVVVPVVPWRPPCPKFKGRQV